jgi:Zn-dependent protease
LKRIPDEPFQELWVALAGPAVNVVIAAGLSAWLHFSATLVPLEALTVASGPLLERSMMINLILVIFNMLPAFRMDGGRGLRALLSVASICVTMDDCDT